MPAPTKEPFHIAITMAGAVSAGAYTGGVIDYLFETLDSWQKAKDKNLEIQEKHPADFLEKGYDPSVPMHDIIVEVMSGASAGGMTASIATLGLHEGIHPLNEDNPKGDHNKLYESWVKMVDEEDGKNTLSQMLTNSDLESDGEVRSVLNSEVIEKIGKNAAKLKQVKDRLPAYMSEDFDIILTISNLRGLKFVIDFEGSGASTGTAITMHSGFLRYKIVPQEKLVVMERGCGELCKVIDMN